MNRGTISIPIRGTTDFFREDLPIMIREPQGITESPVFFSDNIVLGEQYEGAGVGENISINIS